MNLWPHTILLLDAAPVDDGYGNQTRDWSFPSTVSVSDCSVQPIEGDEATVGRDTVVSRWRLLVKGTSAPLTAGSRVRFNGVDYDVDGEVQRWDFGSFPHLSCLLTKGTERS